MSLIQEALRRQQEELANAANAAPPLPEVGATPPPPVPEPKPEPKPEPETKPVAKPEPEPKPEAEPKPEPEPEPERIPVPEPAAAAPEPDPEPPAETEPEATPAVKSAPSQRALPTLLGILIVILLLLGGAIWLIVFAVQQLQESRANEAEAGQPPVVDVAEAPPTPPDSAAPLQPPPRAPKPKPKPKPAPEPKAADWPKLALTGVIGSGNTGSAIINNEVLAVDEIIDGVRVLSVTTKGVELECGSERRFLRVGDAID